jgi:carboxylesterase type B
MSWSSLSTTDLVRSPKSCSSRVLIISGDFGFLVLNETGINGNYGISDQVTALQWVHDNIHNFGGNASLVTILGQSAGAGSVRALLQSPPAEGLFSAAILQSDLGIPSYSHYLSLEEEIASQTIPILNATGCLGGSGAAELACLRAYNASALVALPTVANNIVVDGKYVVTPAINYNGTGHVNAVPLLIGTMRDDGAPFLSYVNTNNLTAALVKNGLSVPEIAESGVFPVPNGANVSLDIFNVTAEAETDSWFRCLDYATAYAAAKTNTLPEVYYYECLYSNFLRLKSC